MMAATEELIGKVRELPPEQVQMVSDFIDELDNDVGLEEDIAEFDRRLEAQKKPGGKDGIPVEEVRKELNIRLEKQGLTHEVSS